MADDDETFAEEEEEAEEGESEVLHDLGKGLIAGFAGTLVVAIIIAILQNTLGLLPQSNVIGMLTRMTGLGWAGAGWAVLFVVGTIIGIGFAALDAHVEHVTGAGEIVRGAIFGVLIWIALLLMFIPFYGTEAISTGFLIAVLVTNIVYGAVLGWVYGALQPETAPT